MLHYSANSSPAYAASLAERLSEAPERFTVEPMAGWQVPEYGDPAVREVFVRPYRMVYQVSGDRCLIVAIIHASRDLRGAVDPDRFPTPPAEK